MDLLGPKKSCISYFFGTLTRFSTQHIITIKRVCCNQMQFFKAFKSPILRESLAFDNSFFNVVPNNCVIKVDRVLDCWAFFRAETDCIQGCVQVLDKGKFHLCLFSKTAWFHTAPKHNLCALEHCKLIHSIRFMKALASEGWWVFNKNVIRKELRRKKNL